MSESASGLVVPSFELFISHMNAVLGTELAEGDGGMSVSVLASDALSTVLLISAVSRFYANPDRDLEACLHGSIWDLYRLVVSRSVDAQFDGAFGSQRRGGE